jgi:hypothetical protein
MTALDGLMRDYRVAFLHYLPRREEAALLRGYELGRSAVADGLSILELARVHHEVLLEVLRETPTAELPELATSASEFLLEVLATFDMAQRSYREAHVRDEQGPSTGERVQGAPVEGATAAG